MALAAPASPRPARREAQRRNVRRTAVIGWLFVGPVVLGTILFNVLPIIPTIGLSFTNWNGTNSAQWLGFDNYERMFTDDPLLPTSLLNTLLFTAGYVPLGIAIGLALALLVNNKLKGMPVVRAFLFVPYVTSLVAVGIVARWVFSDQYGAINQVLGALGLDGPHWLGERGTAMFAVIVTAVWANMGFNMIVLLAGLQNVPDVLMEAAKLDGAGPVTRFRSITIPFLSPTFFLLIILQTIGSFQVFSLIFVMTEGGPGDGTYVYIYHLWYEAFQMRNMGYASAMAVVLFAVLGLVTFVQARLSRRWVFYQ
jgi:multiple sugar transport system permease protein